MYAHRITPGTIAEAAEAMRLVREGHNAEACDDCGKLGADTYYRCGHPQYVCAECYDDRCAEEW